MIASSIIETTRFTAELEACIEVQKHPQETALCRPHGAMTDLLEKMNKNVEQPGREAKRLKIRHNYEEDDVFERPRASGKPGGRWQWVATKETLMSLWVDSS